MAAICGESADGLNPMTSLVVGRLAPPLLLAEAIANGFGDVAGRFAKKHDAGEFGEAIDRCFSPHSSLVASLGWLPVSQSVVELLGHV